jgi:hypothetical protein
MSLMEEDRGPRCVVILSPLSPITQVCYWETWRGVPGSDTRSRIRMVAIAPACQERSLPVDWVRAPPVLRERSVDAWSHPRMLGVMAQLLQVALDEAGPCEVYFLVSGDTVPVVSARLLLKQQARTVFTLGAVDTQDTSAYTEQTYSEARSSLISGNLTAKGYEYLCRRSHSAWFAVLAVDLVLILDAFRRFAPRLSALYAQATLSAAPVPPPEESWWFLLYMSVARSQCGARALPPTLAAMAALDGPVVVEARGANFSYSPFSFDSTEQEHLVAMRSYGQRRKSALPMWLNMDAFVLQTQVQLAGAGGPALFLRKAGTGTVPSTFWISEDMERALEWIRRVGKTSVYTDLQRRPATAWSRDAVAAGFGEHPSLTRLLGGECFWSVAGDSTPARDLAVEGSSSKDVTFDKLEARGRARRRTLAANLSRLCLARAAAPSREEARAAIIAQLHRSAVDKGAPSALVLLRLCRQAPLVDLRRLLPYLGPGQWLSASAPTATAGAEPCAERPAFLRSLRRVQRRPNELLWSPERQGACREESEGVGRGAQLGHSSDDDEESELDAEISSFPPTEGVGSGNPSLCGLTPARRSQLFGTAALELCQAWGHPRRRRRLYSGYYTGSDI